MPLKYAQIILLSGLVFIGPSLGGCGLMAPPKAVKRAVGAKKISLVNPDSVKLERSGDGSSLSLTFEASKAANCQLAFYPVDSATKSSGPGSPCAGKSATTFSETLGGVPKDQLVAVIIKSWDTAATPADGVSITVNETTAKADDSTVNLMLVDMGAGRLELTAIATSSTPSVLMSGAIGGENGCWLSDAKSIGLIGSRKALLIQGATSKGFINSTTTRTSPSVFTGVFSTAQRQSSEWSLSAKTTGGSGQLRVAKPTLLNTVTFAGREQSMGISDSLEDVDPPALKLDANSTLVATWSLLGEAKNAAAFLSIPPSGLFPGITCRGAASAGKITVPTSLIAKIPAGTRLWASLRIDSWQAFDSDRWAVRVSDWKSMGISRQ